MDADKKTKHREYVKAQTAIRRQLEKGRISYLSLKLPDEVVKVLADRYRASNPDYSKTDSIAALREVEQIIGLTTGKNISGMLEEISNEVRAEAEAELKERGISY